MACVLLAMCGHVQGGGRPSWTPVRSAGGGASGRGVRPWRSLVYVGCAGSRFDVMRPRSQRVLTSPGRRVGGKPGGERRSRRPIGRESAGLQREARFRRTVIVDETDACVETLGLLRKSRPEVVAPARDLGGANIQELVVGRLLGTRVLGRVTRRECELRRPTMTK